MEAPGAAPPGASRRGGRLDPAASRLHRGRDDGGEHLIRGPLRNHDRHGDRLAAGRPGPRRRRCAARRGDDRRQPRRNDLGSRVPIPLPDQGAVRRRSVPDRGLDDQRRRPHHLRPRGRQRLLRGRRRRRRRRHADRPRSQEQWLPRRCRWRRRDPRWWWRRPPLRGERERRDRGAGLRRLPVRRRGRRRPHQRLRPRRAPGLERPRRPTRGRRPRRRETQLRPRARSGDPRPHRSPLDRVRAPQGSPPPRRPQRARAPVRPSPPRGRPS